VAIAGKFVPVKPRDWAKQRDVSIDLRLGYGERKSSLANISSSAKRWRQDPVIAPLFGIEERRNLYKLVMEAKGHKNVAQILRDVKPEDLHPQPDPMHGRRAGQAQGRDGRYRPSANSAPRRKPTTRPKLDQLKTDMEQRFKTLEFMLKNRDMDRKEAETDNRIEISEREMDLAEEAEAKAPERTPRLGHHQPQRITNEHRKTTRRTFAGALRYRLVRPWRKASGPRCWAACRRSFLPSSRRARPNAAHGGSAFARYHRQPTRPARRARALTTTTKSEGSRRHRSRAQPEARVQPARTLQHEKRRLRRGRVGSSRSPTPTSQISLNDESQPDQLAARA
jgi:hypothetical protein